jgi:hypothetical protein
MRWSLGAGALALMGGGGLAALRGSAPHVRGLRCLSDHEHRTLEALARALLPQSGAFRVGARDVDLALAFDRYLADEPPFVRADLARGLLLLEFGPVVFEGRRITFSRLPEAERLAHFERWTRSELLLRRQVSLAFRKFLHLVFYDSPAVWPHIGYDGPLFKA